MLARRIGQSWIMVYRKDLDAVSIRRQEPP